MPLHPVSPRSLRPEHSQGPEQLPGCRHKAPSHGAGDEISLSLDLPPHPPTSEGVGSRPQRRNPEKGAKPAHLPSSPLPGPLREGDLSPRPLPHPTYSGMEELGPRCRPPNAGTREVSGSLAVLADGPVGSKAPFPHNLLETNARKKSGLSTEGAGGQTLTSLLNPPCLGLCAAMTSSLGRGQCAVAAGSDLGFIRGSLCCSHLPRSSASLTEQLGMRKSLLSVDSSPQREGLMPRPVLY